MEFNDVVKNRRSIRAFDNRRVSINTIFKIIEDGLLAPRSGNVQDWYVVIVQNKAVKFSIAEACIGQYWITQAPFILVVCSKPSKTKISYGKRGEFYAIQNGSAAIENMLLSIENEGLGSCWIGAFEEEALKRIIRAPEGTKILAVLPVGYPLENPPMPKRPDLRNIIYFEKYGEKELKKV